MDRRRSLLAASMQSGGSGEYGEEIIFYLDTRPLGDIYVLRAYEGMTWEDWISTEDNTLGFYIEEETQVVLWEGLMVYNFFDSGERQTASHEIMSDTTYGL